MMLFEYLAIRNQRFNQANAITVAEAKAIGIKWLTKGWHKKNARKIVPQQLADAVHDYQDRRSLKAIANLASSKTSGEMGSSGKRVSSPSLLLD